MTPSEYAERAESMGWVYRVRLGMSRHFCLGGYAYLIAGGALGCGHDTSSSRAAF